MYSIKANSLYNRSCKNHRKMQKQYYTCIIVYTGSYNVKWFERGVLCITIFFKIYYKYVVGMLTVYILNNITCIKNQTQEITSFSANSELNRVYPPFFLLFHRHFHPTPPGQMMSLSVLTDLNQQMSQKHVVCCLQTLHWQPTHSIPLILEKEKKKHSYMSFDNLMMIFLIKYIMYYWLKNLIWLDGMNITLYI